MQINFEIIYTDEEGNYFHSIDPPGYLPQIIAEMQRKTLDELEESFFRFTSYSCNYSLQAETILSDVLDCYLNYLGIEKKKFYMCSSMVHFLIEKEIIHITDYNFKINKLFNYYGNRDELTVFLVFSFLQGDIWREDKIRYYMNSHEAGHHNMPHVHVMVGHEYEASVGILNASILAGNLPPKYEKRIIQKIDNNRQHLLECWNKMTDGMEVDINLLMGVTNYLN